MSIATPQLSICVISFNRPDNILALMKSILKQNDFEHCIVEFLILNNGSTVDYTEVVTFINNHPQLKIQYLLSDENLGVPRGRNKMMQLATAPYILIIDDDIEFKHPGDLIRLNTLMDEPFFIENNVAVTTLNVHYFDTDTPQISAFPHKQYHAYKDIPRFITGHFIGAANLNKKDAVAAVGYYGDGIFYGMEEYELSFKLIEKGYTLAYDNSVTILHKESPHGRMHSNLKHAMMWYNKVFVFWRFLPFKYVCTADFLWGLRYLKLSKFDWKGFWANRKKIAAMKRSTPRTPLQQRSLDYLKRVGARLWY